MKDSGIDTSPQSGPHAARQAAGLRGFWSLFVTQFQGAFSDNVIKNLVIFMILGLNVSLAVQHQFGESVGALFAVPFILFSMAGGYLADRFGKRTIMISVKVFEVGVMIFALAGLAYGNRNMLLACVFLMGVHSAFFGPSKYGSLPELLPEKKLSWGNGLIELGTFMAIILGTVAAAYMAKYFHGHQWWSGVILIVLAFLGLTTSLGITRVPAADPGRKFNLNFPGEVWRCMRDMHGDRPLALAVIGNTYFTFLGALMLLNLFFYGADVLHVDETRIGYLNVALALGIGLGSVAAGYLSGGKIEYGLVPLGAFGLSVLSAWVGLQSLGLGASIVALALLGFFGGFFIVPIAALLQHRPAPEKKGQFLAAANLLSFVGVFFASGAHYLMTHFGGFSPRQIFLVGGVITLIGGIYAMYLLPDALLRFALWGLTCTIYRVRAINREHIPERGGALLVANHSSWVDALLLTVSTDRQIRFVMFKEGYDKPWVKPFARILRVIPISSEQRPRDLIKSLQTASAALQAGEVVCIFAEGQITRIGQMLPFRRGMERIMKDVDAPIVPVAIDGIWGSIFSYEHGRVVRKIPRRIPYPVTVSFGKPMPPNTPAFAVREVVQELLANAWPYRRDDIKPLQRAFLRTARRHPFRFAMADAQTPKVSFGSALTRTVLLARQLKKIWAGQDKVGLMLPPSVPGALVNYAALLMGKVPVNLNYTVSEQTLASCIQQCGIKTVISSKAFLEKVKLTVPCELIYLENLLGQKSPETPEPSENRGSEVGRVTPCAPSPACAPAAGRGLPALPVEAHRMGEGKLPTPLEKLTAFLMAWLLPAGALERALGRGKEITIDDLATIIFSSGSTGDPKGVMLSHYNISSNVEQLEQVFGLDADDRILGTLPFFHSFGFTGTLALPAMVGLGVVYHANPLDTKMIGPLVHHNAVTFLLATPTFLQLYLRGCAPEDFGSLRVVMTGAEKLPDRLSAAFEERFGIRPLEGYGCTECSPAVAVNTHDFRAAGFRQVGAKRGKIGHPLPGVSVHIVDPETGRPQPLGQPGMLLVRGPNIMQGYLGRPEKTAEVLHDGWYTTGDIATLDEDGFLQITDRLSRFSKIGGEMVPHIKVEEKLHELAGVTEQTFVVTGVPDEKKGERLVVLHKLTTEKLQPCLDKLAQSDLPNLWKPRAESFFHIDALPYLGTGKLDLRKVKELAAQFSCESATSAAGA